MLRLVQFNRNIRSIRRYRQIGRVLFKYGFDQLLEYLNLSHFIARGRRLFGRDETRLAALSAAQRMRLALEELGPSFVKLGQLLSTRPDVLDWDKSDWYYTPVSQYAALSHLSTMPRAHVSATATSSARDHGEVETAVTLRNSSPGKAAAFFLDLTVRGADSSPVQPVLWTDNEVTLFPGETVTVRARYRSADVKGGQARVRISGWNVSEQTIPAPTG